MADIKLRLIGKDQEIHAEGSIDTQALAQYSIIKRNERFYLFNMLVDGVVIFMEDNQPLFLGEDFGK